jgi:hypothetical protein
MHRFARVSPSFSLLVALVGTLAPLAGCDCGGPAPAGTCHASSDCRAGQQCVDSRCVAAPDGGTLDASGDTGPLPDTGMTCPLGHMCGAACCGTGQVCGTNVMCCDRASLCGTTCCGAGEVCEGAVCRRDCGTNARCTDAMGAPVCCGAGEVCASGQCFAPTDACTDFFECPTGQYCEPSLGRCLPQPTGPACQVRPMGGAVVPTLLWHWDGTGRASPQWNQVMMAPMVANLTDDDGDGHIDARDVPDVIFSTFCGSHDGSCAFGSYGQDGILRAVSGDDGHPIFDVTSAAYRVNPGSQVAIGDLDGDHLVEIVTCASDPSGIGGVIAFHHDGSFYWRTSDSRVQCAEAAPAIADFDGDGHPEVFIRYTILGGTDGSVRSHHACVGTGGWATSAHSPCDYTTAADIDGDGHLDLVGGNVVYRLDGTTVYDHTADFDDGYPAVGDLDLDGRPEVVVVHSAFHPTPYQGDHELRAFRHDGTLLWGPIDINQGHAPAADVASGAVGGGGPPTIANVDDDPEPEIAMAGAYAFVVFEPNGTARWSSATRDHSSRKTGSTVFDFDGDGAAEAVYSDEQWLRVYDGRTGNVRFCACNTTATLWEYPVVADVNNDGHAEIVAASNDYGGPSFSTCVADPILGACENARIAAGENLGTHGVRVFASPTRDWVATRHIWNQHTYHVTNVTESGDVPAMERPNWSSPGLNDFRANVQPGATNVPDLVPTDLAVELNMCGARMTLDFRITNDGWSASPTGVPATVYVEEMGSFRVLGRVMTSRALFPGDFEAFSMPYDLGARPATDTVRFRVIVDDPSDMPLPSLVECHADNNTAETMATCGFLG